MNKIDMTTGETLQTSPACAFGAAMFDLAAMEIFTTEETPAVMGTYGNYIMIPCDPMANTFNQGWNLTSYLAQYTGGSKFVAMTSVGLYMDDDTVNELVYALDDAGYIWALFYDGTTSIGFDFIPTNLDLSFPMSGDLQYCSLVDAADGSLFLSYFTGTTNEIYYLTPSADGSMFNAVRVGDVGEDVWPAALTAVTKNGEAADSNAVAISTENMMTVDAAEISAEEIAAVNAQLAFATAASVDNTAKAAEATNAAEETKTAETVSFTAASSKFAPLPIETNSSDDNTFIVTVMAKDAKGGIVDSTNGKITVTYDPTQVTTEQVVVSGQYSAVNDDGNGTIVLAYVGPDAIPAGEPAATVIFKNKATKNTEVVVEHDEYADQKPGYVETKVVELTNLPRPAISVSLAEKVVLNYYVDEDLVTQTNQLVVKKNGEALSEDEYEVVFENNEARISISLNANDMCDEMSFQILDSKGNPVTQCRVASIRDYVRLRLDSAKASDKEKRVFMAALDYGAMAQLVLDATETNLANNIITAKDRELLDNFTWPTATNDPDEAVGSTNESKFAVTASLKDAVVLNFYIYKTDLDDNKIQIKRNGTVLTEGEDYTVTEVGTEYCVSIPMNANHMCHIFSAQVVDAEGNAVYAARSLSMRHYVGMRLVNPNATAAEKRVFVAALDYGALAQLAMNENATDLANRYITDADREALKP